MTQIYIPLLILMLKSALKIRRYVLKHKMLTTNARYYAVSTFYYLCIYF